MENRNTNFTATNDETLVSRMEELETRKHFSASHADIGININQASTASMQKAIPVLKQMGVTSVRLWAGVDYTSHTFTGVLQRAIDYHNAGFDVMVVVNPQSTAVPNAADVKGWFSWAMQNSALKSAVDRWEIGNEVDSSHYFNGTLKQYVDNELAPAYSVLHAAGEKVVSAGVSWNPQDIKTMIGEGLLNDCDFIGFHPYANSVDTQGQHIQQLEDIVAGRKPLVASEWNIRGYENNKTAWASAVEDAYSQVRDAFAFNYYFCAFVQNTPAGPAGLLNADGSKNELFWNAFSTFQQQNQKAGTSGNTSSSPTSSEASTDGNTAAGADGTISGVLWNDSDGDGTRDSNEALTGVRTVFIDSNGNGRLDGGEKSTSSDDSGKYSFTGLSAGTYKISRVFPAGYRMSNSPLTDLTVNLNPGQVITNANIGSTDKAVGISAPEVSLPLASAPIVTSTTPSTSGLGTITGLLWNDTNADGQISAGETVTGIRTVFIDSNGDGILDNNEQSTQSDAAGVYSFTGLSAGTYKISRVYPNGYHMSNSNVGYVTANLEDGSVLGNINLGTTNRAA